MSDQSLADLLRSVRRQFPPALLSGPGWRRLLARAAVLPPAAADTPFGFEFRLGDPEPSADLFVVVRPNTPIARHYVRRGEGAAPDSAAAALAWYVREMQRSDSFAARSTVGVFLEYDVVGVPEGQLPPPGVFLRLRLSPNGWRETLQPSPGRLAGLLATAAGWPADEGERRAVERAFAALPSGARVAHAGALPGRWPRAIRLVIQEVDETEVPGFLERLNWPGPVQAVSSRLTELRSVIARFRLALEVTARGLSPRLGLELYRGEREWDPGKLGNWRAMKRSDWQPLVEWLTERGWCRPDKAAGLLEWTGTQALYGPEGVFLAYQGVNHIKVSVGDGAAEAKGYAGIGFGAIAPQARPD